MTFDKIPPVKFFRLNKTRERAIRFVFVAVPCFALDDKESHIWHNAFHVATHRCAVARLLVSGEGHQHYVRNDASLKSVVSCVRLALYRKLA